MTKHADSFLSHCISLSSVQLPFFFLVYSLISLIFHWTYYSSTDSLISVNSHHSSHNGLFSLFSPYFFTFYFLPFLAIFSWSMCTGLMYLNLVVTICILYSQSTQYKYISSLIPQVLSSLEAHCFIFSLILESLLPYL